MRAAVPSSLGKVRCAPACSPTARRELLAGILFTAPWIVGFLVFLAYPIGAAFYYSLTYYTVLAPPSWVGLANYWQLLSHDNLFAVSVFNTAYFVLFSVPLGIVVALGMAVLLNNRRLFHLGVFRTIYYLPSILPLVATSVLWLWILNPQSGLVNHFLSALGLPAPGWLASTFWSKPALIFMSLWGTGNTMVVLLAALQGVPQELYEAAAVDGATRWRRFWHVTLPQISPSLLFAAIVNTIGGFQYFTQQYIMTGSSGTPANSSLMYATYLFDNAFSYNQMGYASAMAWLLFSIILVCVIAIFVLSKKLVYYAAE